MNRGRRLRHIADRLDRFAQVSTARLARAITEDGACMVALTGGDPPELTGEEVSDRKIAARLCSGCRLQEACLELELRWSGPVQVGLFGALPEDDRRDLYPLWRARRAKGGDRR